MLLPIWLATHALIGAALQAPIPESPPLLAPDGPTVHDFGLVYAGDDVAHQFALIVGEDPLTIESVSPT